MTQGFYEGSAYGNEVRRVNNIEHTHDFRIKKVIVAPTRSSGYRQMVQRAYTSTVTPKDVHNILDDVLRFGNVNQNTLSTSNVVSVSSNFSDLAGISGGWQAPRYTVQLEVACIPKPNVNPYLVGSNMTYDLIITGYSDPSNDFVSYGNHANPHLKFQINNVQMVSKLAKSNGSTVVTDVKNTGVTNPECYSATRASLSIKPVDIISDISGHNLANSMGATVLNGSISMATAPSLVHRTDLVGKHYTNTIVNSLVQGAASTNSLSGVQDVFGDVASMAYQAATFKVSSEQLGTIPFFIALQENTGDYMGYWFTMGILQLLDPTFNEHMITYVNVDDTARYNSESMFLTNDTAELMDISKVASKVTELHHILSTLMISNHLGTLELHIWNVYQDSAIPGHKQLTPCWEMPGNKISWSYNVIPDPNAMATIAAKLRMQIDGYVRTIIDPVLSERGELAYEVYVSMDISNDTTIFISIEGGQMIPYRFPTFADMAFMPMAGTTEDKGSLVANMGALTEEIVSTLTTNVPTF